MVILDEINKILKIHQAKFNKEKNHNFSNYYFETKNQYTLQHGIFAGFQFLYF